MRSLILGFVVLAGLLWPFRVQSETIHTGKLISAILEVAGSQKIYVDAACISFQGNEILFLNAQGQWMPASLIGRDDNGIYVYGYFDKCPECGRRAPDGLCVNPNCPRYMK